MTLPAEILAILERGDFPKLDDDEYAKVGASLKECQRRATRFSDLQSPEGKRVYDRKTEVKNRLRAIYEYNTTIRQLAAQAQTVGARRQGQDKQAPAGKPPAGGEPEGKEADTGAALPERVKIAYEQYLRAVPECRGKDGRAPTDRQCYDWLVAHNDGDPVPVFDTWQRYVREVRRHFDQQKNAPRAGRGHGRSIVSAKDIEPPATDKAD